MTAPSAPRHLSSESKRLYRRLVADYDLAAEPHALRVLALACEALDRAEEARVRVDAEGMTVPDRFGQLKPHPAVAIERDSAIRAARLFRELSLDAEVDTRLPRPTGARS